MAVLSQKKKNIIHKNTIKSNQIYKNAFKIRFFPLFMLFM